MITHPTLKRPSMVKPPLRTSSFGEITSLCGLLSSSEDPWSISEPRSDDCAKKSFKKASASSVN